MPKKNDTHLKNRSQSNRIVIKISSKLLIDTRTQKVKTQWLENIAQNISTLIENGAEIVIVCSGSIALGTSFLKESEVTNNVENKQAASAIGRIELIKTFQNVFSKYNICVAQILLSISDTETRRRHLNARATINALFRHKTIPIIFENGTVSTTELREGDNDILAAHLAQTISADTLILLSSLANGIYQSDPQNDKKAELIPVIPLAEQDCLEKFKDKGKKFHPDLAPKIHAAEIAGQAGCKTYVTNGTDENAILDLLTTNTKENTVFTTPLTPNDARQKWISSHLLTSGGIIVSETGVKMILENKGLHPQYILSINGIFQRGELISIANQLGQEIGRGLSAYCWKDAVRIRGSKDTRVIDELGFGGREVMIAADDLVITEIKDT